ncbi:hypothetical protein Tco_0566084 [Tanacetum coccineum]
MEGFDSMVEHAWLSFSHSDSNAMVRFKKKLQDLKSIIRLWVKDKKFYLHNAKNSLQNDLISIDKDLERENVSDDILLNRMELNRRLQDIKLLEVKDLVPKSKINGYRRRVRNSLNLSWWMSLDRAVSMDEIRGCLETGENNSPWPRCSKRRVEDLWNLSGTVQTERGLGVSSVFRVLNRALYVRSGCGASFLRWSSYGISPFLFCSRKWRKEIVCLIKMELLRSHRFFVGERERVELSAKQLMTFFSS